ncbi:hypothetical protein N7462_005965 [Penicillium macrosclerotiorum]|uniref:uncharacterized protein n=1 Tax=Penicillium macrosclerotiorum TaxID=303699 RepID=UPI0025465859|nr:uncharacterized protein N7462_005965 [Penicillium macrosclerotiorum]KAJ5682800.1 hypothetical protein N7462_005965 [Penicillium macrosclerotiorum]
MKDISFIVASIIVDIFLHFHWLQFIQIISVLLFVGVPAIILAWIALITCVQRNLILWSENGMDTQDTLLGRPLLFPSQLTHARMFPERYHYGIDYFLVGIPVGLCGRAGAIISIDSYESNPDHLSKETLRSKLLSFSRSLIWFRINPGQYLHRGESHLTSQGENPKKYPYAYLISIPQFFWWTKSPISYWYLYSSTKELSAMIMEINNSYGEKKNSFFRLHKEVNSSFPTAKACTEFSTIQARSSSGTKAVKFVSSAPSAKYYKGTWEKDIFASPFEKVEGGFTLRFMDPLDPQPEKGGPLHSNMTLMSTSGKPKISSRLFSQAPPLDPLLASSWDVTKCLLRWSFVIPSSIGRIVVEALRIRFRGNMPYLNKPDVKPNNIPRNASETERVLEGFFRLFLFHLVESCQIPLTVIYTPAKSLHLHPIFMHSSAKMLTSAPPPTLLIQPLTPQFYTNILNYEDIKVGLACEIEDKPQVSDPISKRLWVSDSILLNNFISSAEGSSSFQKQAKPQPDSADSDMLGLAAGYLVPRRNSKSMSFMDSFIRASCSARQRRKYKAARIHRYLTERFALGSYRLASVYGFLLQIAVMQVAWRSLRQMLYYPNPLCRENFLVASGVFFLGVRAWSILTDSLY